MVTANRVGAADVAKLARKHLAATFPACRFRVRTSRHSGGSSVDVSWTDGPTEGRVKLEIGTWYGGHIITRRGEREPHDLTRGAVELVMCGNTSISFRRELSPRFVERLTAACIDFWPLSGPIDRAQTLAREMCTAARTGSTRIFWSIAHRVRLVHGHRSLGQLIRSASENHAEVAR
jgi:hypothetical protein